MSALAEVQAAGGCVWAEGDRLKYRLPHGRADLLELLRLEKPRLLPLLRLCETACRELALEPAELAASLTAEDAEAVLAEGPEVLRAYAEAVAERKQRERGEVPANYTARTVCRGCGPVPIFEGAPGEVLGCPWCWNRLAGKPVPSIE